MFLKTPCLGEKTGTSLNTVPGMMAGRLFLQVALWAIERLN
jgi:hypothetical protein